VAGFLEAPSAGLWVCFALALGLIVGSFANVCIHRLPLRQSVVAPRSRCPACGAPIGASDNVPLLSYALLRGRCRSCRAPISLRYPAVEAANGLLWAGLAAKLGPTPQALVAMGVATALLVLSLIDLDHHLLPDAITLPGIVLGLLASFLPGPPTPLASAAAAAVGYLALAALALLARRYYGQEALGQGDWKLVAMLGAFLGPERLVMAWTVGIVLGALAGASLWLLRRASGTTPLPLGTFLGLGGLATLLGHESLSRLWAWWSYQSALFWTLFHE
jgi:leader peptidase (prepilin peptidase)/N-methyltransferase